MNHGDDKSLAFPHKVANQVVDQFPLKILSRKHFFVCERDESTLLGTGKRAKIGFL